MAFSPEVRYTVNVTAVPDNTSATPTGTKTVKTTVSIPDTGPIHESLALSAYTNMSQSIDISALKTRISELEEENFLLQERIKEMEK